MSVCQHDHTTCDTCGMGFTAMTNPAAEPRWPSGPDARYPDLDDPATVERLALALQMVLVGTKESPTDADLVDARALIAALRSAP